MSERPKIRVVSATEAKNRFGEMLKGAYQRAEHLVVERSGIPVAVIVPIQDYDPLAPAGGFGSAGNAIRETDRAAARARTELLEFLDKIHAQMPEVAADEVEQDIQQAIEAVRR